MPFWDDIELLKAIDELEAEHSRPVWYGEEVLRKMAGRDVFNEQEREAFSRELTLARNAGLIDFEFRPGYGQPSPRINDYAYLQSISEVRLTIAGRDRARGRMVLVALDEAGEDDGRAIAGLTLERVARILGDTYTDSQLPQFFLDSGIPEPDVPAIEGTKWVYIHALLLSLLQGGSASRRVLRHFLGKWLSNELHTGPTDDERVQILGDLARQGWHLAEGRLVIGEREIRPIEADLLAAEDDPSVHFSHMHSALRSGAIRKLFMDGYRAAAIFEAFKLVATRVKDLTGLEEDGVRLMTTVLNRDHPLLRLNAGMTRSDKDEQEGFMHIFMGAMLGIRNPKAHDPFVEPDVDRALEYLALASLLLRRLDEARTQDASKP